MEKPATVRYGCAADRAEGGRSWATETGTGPADATWRKEKKKKKKSPKKERGKQRKSRVMKQETRQPRTYTHITLTTAQ